MRIAIYHELHNGGARRMANELARYLMKKNTVDLYILGKLGENEKKFYTSTKEIGFRVKKWKGRDWKTRLYKDTIELVKLRNKNKKIAKIIDNGNYDIVFVHPSQFTQAPFILQFLKTKKYYMCQEYLRNVYEKDLKINTRMSSLKSFYETVNRYIRKKIDFQNISCADIIFANSNFSKKNIKKAYGLSSKVLYPGVDTNFFKPSTGKKDIDILYMGSKEGIDNYKVYQNLVSKVPEYWKLYEHIGGGKWLTDEELRKLYQRSKIVMTLYKNEPFGLIPIEAASCGAVVIALDSGGHKESVINGVTGYLVPEKTDVIFQTIKDLLSNPRRLSKLSSNARNNAVKNWQWEKFAKELEKTFRIKL